MAIKVTLEKTEQPEPTFPALRMWRADIGKEETLDYGPLVVLFVSNDVGVALSGKDSRHIGIADEWVSIDNTDAWVPCSINLSSVN